MYRRKGFVLAAILILAAAGVVCGEDCRDRDGDGDLDLDDFVIVLHSFGETFPPHEGGDINGDGICDLYDLASLKFWCFDPGCCSLPGPAPLGAMELFIDATGEAFLFNPTSTAIPLGGYQITSASGQLDTAAWRTFFDAFASDPETFLDVFGPEGYGFRDMSYLDSAAAEFNVGAEVMLAPGYMHPIGQIVSGLPTTDLVFLYANESAPDGVYMGTVVSDQIPPGDADMDGDVDLDDFAALKASFGTGTTWAQGDFDGDLDVDLDDFAILKQSFGTG